MTQGLRRFHASRQTHFITFSCYRRLPNLRDPNACDLLLRTLETTRQRFVLRVFGYVLMPEYVHLLISEPERGTVADAMHFLKLSSAKRLRASNPSLQALTAFWQKRYYDRNVRDHHEFRVKLRYIHRNPVRRGLCASPEDWPWSSFSHYAFGEMGVVEIESEWTAKGRRPLTINPG